MNPNLDHPSWNIQVSKLLVASPPTTFRKELLKTFGVNLASWEGFAQLAQEWWPKDVGETRQNDFLLGGVFFFLFALPEN